MNEPTCRIVRGDSAVYTSDRRGIAPLVEAIESGIDLTGCTAYDKIVGKAAALLYAHMGVSAVHAGVLSAGGETVLKAHGISYSFETFTDKIINRAGDGICPMERAVESINSPRDAYAALSNKLKELQAK